MIGSFVGLLGTASLHTLTALCRGFIYFQQRTSYSIRYIQHLCSIGVLTTGTLMISALSIFSENNPVTPVSYYGLIFFAVGLLGLPLVDYYHSETPTTSQKVNVWLTIGCVGSLFFAFRYPILVEISGISLIALAVVDLHQLFTGTI